ncbi:MAG: PH domain-containing protein [Oscillospiraceae bacterium]
MDILLYYILRRFFVRISFSEGIIHLEKGLIFLRSSRIPYSSVTAVEIRRTPLLRILGGKRVTVRTLGGKAAEFYLRKSEPLPFLPQDKGITLRPKISSVLFGAFIDTRALSGVLIFSAAIKRVGAIFGSSYYDRIISAIQSTANGVSDTLALLHIAVPKAASVIAVFVIAAWGFALLVKAAAMARFRVTLRGNSVSVRRGIITLYEYHVSSAAPCCFVICDAISSLLANAAPLYLHGIMILPPARNNSAERLIRILLGNAYSVPEKKLTLSPPKRALFGHCALPLGWAAVPAAALLLIEIMRKNGAPIYAETLKTALWCIIAVLLWTAAVYAAYMFRSGSARGGGIVRISARRFARLYTVFSRENDVVSAETIRSPFSRTNGLCDCRLAFPERTTARLRQVPVNGARRFWGSL